MLLGAELARALARIRQRLFGVAQWPDEILASKRLRLAAAGRSGCVRGVRGPEEVLEDEDERHGQCQARDENDDRDRQRAGRQALRLPAR